MPPNKKRVKGIHRGSSRGYGAFIAILVSGKSAVLRSSSLRLAFVGNSEEPLGGHLPANVPAPEFAA
jgi:hypothetical protein